MSMSKSVLRLGQFHSKKMISIAFLSLSLFLSNQGVAGGLCADLLAANSGLQEDGTQLTERIKATLTPKVWTGSLAQKPRVIVVSGPSASGKTTLMELLLKEFPNNFQASVSTTTRKQRPGEVDGKHYHFIDIPEFRTRLGTGDFLEHAEVHGNFYGTSKSSVEKIVQSGRSVFLLIDVKGAAKVKQILKDKVTTIFIQPPSMEILEKRLRDRNTESEDAIQKRLKNAASEMQEGQTYDHRVINDDLESAYQNLKDALEKIP